MALVPQAYKGREQSFIKHIILEKYLEVLAYKALFTYGEFNFVDAFSGPWKSADANFQDTSFIKAIEVLTRVQRDIRALRRPAFVRCIFVEKTKNSYERLEAACKSVKEIKVIPLRGKFEDLIPEILKQAAKGFVLAFIDPKGWTGFSFEKIQPLLSRSPNEVLINFMYDFVGRFIEHDDPKIRASLDNLFGSKDWPNKLRTDCSREESIMGLFSDELKGRGKFQYVISTPIMKPTRDRTLYHIVFGTRHTEGIKVYREAERKALRQQIESREQAKLDQRVEKNKQGELLTAQMLPLEQQFHKDLDEERTKARREVLSLLSQYSPLPYAKIWPEILLKCRLRWTELHEIISAMRKSGSIEISTWQPRQRVPKDADILRLLKSEASNG